MQGAGGTGSDDPAVQVAGVSSGAVPVTIGFDGSSRTAWLWLQGALVLLVVLLALPSRRTDDDEADPDSDIAGDDPGTAAPADEPAKAEVAALDSHDDLPSARPTTSEEVTA